MQFLRKFHVETTRNDMRTEFLRGYINREDEALETWNVGVITSGTQRRSEVELGPLGRVPTVNRSKLKPKTEGPANIKALMSRQDVMLDCPGAEFRRDAKWTDLKNLRRSIVGDRPLLLLYPIDANSEPRTGSTERVPLNAVGDQVGLGIVFPGSTTGSGGYYHVDLNPEDTEELDDLEAEISEMEEQGLV